MLGRAAQDDRRLPAHPHEGPGAVCAPSAVTTICPGGWPKLQRWVEALVPPSRGSAASPDQTTKKMPAVRILRHFPKWKAD